VFVARAAAAVAAAVVVADVQLRRRDA